MQLPDVFKIYDIRGLSPGELDTDFAYKLGQAFAEYTKAKTVVLGRDMRLTSPELADALTRSLISQGIDVIDVGLVTTPMFYFAVASGGYDAGIMVTASHNPAQFNGFKMVGIMARPIAVQKIQELRALMERGEFKETGGGSKKELNVYDAYLEKVLSLANPGAIKGLKVVIDAGNGMTGLILSRLYSALNIEVVPLYWDLDGTFPNHEANPIKEETLNDLKKKVLEVGADLGIAYDADGDRIGFVDESGRTVPTDLVGALLAPKILAGHKGSCAFYDVRCTNSLREEIEKSGGVPEMSPVGHALIKKIMLEKDGLFAVELSGHFYFKDFYSVECTDLSALFLLELISKSGKKFSEILAPVRRYFHSGEINFEVKDKKAVMTELQGEIDAKYGTGGVTTKIDGIRIDFTNWWFSVRASNNPDPVVRLNLEAKSHELMEEKVRELTEIINKY